MVIFYCLNTYHYNRNLTYGEKEYKDDDIIRKYDYSRYDKIEDNYDSDEETGSYLKGAEDRKAYHNKYPPKNHKYDKRYVVSLIGRTKEGEKIVCHVIDYKPYFYIRVPDEFIGYEKKFVDWLNEQLACHLKSKYYNLIDKDNTIVTSKYKSIIGYDNKITVIRLYFHNSSALTKAENLFRYKIIALDNAKMHTKKAFNLGGKLVVLDSKTYEPVIYNHGPIAKSSFYIDNNIKPTGWMEIKHSVNASDFTVAKYECSTLCSNVIMRPDILTPPMFTGLAFDIETSPALSGGSNPDETDPIITLCVSVIQTDFVHPITYRKNYALCLLMKPKDTDLFECTVCKDDYDILYNFRNIVLRHQPDYITTYNGFTFDWARIQFKWPRVARCLERWSIFPERICRRIEEKKEMLKQPLLWKYYSIPGIINIDLYVDIQFSDDPKLKMLENNKLKTIAMYYLNDTKDDLGYQEMYKMFNVPYHKGNYDQIDDKVREDIFIIAKYCLKDSSLLHDLIAKRALIPFWYMISSVCTTCITDVVGAGKGKRILNKICEVIKKKDKKLLIPFKNVSYTIENIVKDMLESDPDSKKIYNQIVDPKKRRIYTEHYFIEHKIMGGLVGQCDCGIFDDVATLDVNAEYPNVIISNNLSPEHIIEGDPFCHTCTTTDTTSDEVKCPCGKYIRSKYIVPSQWELNNGIKYYSYIYNKDTGIFPMMLSEFLLQRANVRKVGKSIQAKINAIKKYRKIKLDGVKCVDTSTYKKYAMYLKSKIVDGLVLKDVPDTVALRMKLTDENPNADIDNLNAIDKLVESNAEYIKLDKQAKENQANNEKYFKNEELIKGYEFFNSLPDDADLSKVVFDLKIDYNRTETEQLAVKVINNSVYGVLGQMNYILYRKDLAGMVTYHAREFNINCMKLLEHYLPGSVKVYGDTDSIFFTINDPVVFDGLNAEQKFYKMYNYACIATKIINIDARNRGKKTMTIEFEKIFPRIIFNGKKKRYYGLKIIGANGSVPNPKDAEKMIMGFDFKKKSAAKIEKLMCEQILHLIVHNNVDQILNYFTTMIDDIYAGVYPVEYFVYRKRFKGPDAYKDKNILQYKLWLNLCDLLGDKAPGAGEDIFYIYRRITHRMRNTGTYDEGRKRDLAIPIERYDKETDLIDYKLYIKQIYSYHDTLLEWLVQQKKLPADFKDIILETIYKHDPNHSVSMDKYL
jgi:DNA polymerase elongation subunit (family B)